MSKVSGYFDVLAFRLKTWSHRLAKHQYPRKSVFTRSSKMSSNPGQTVLAVQLPPRAAANDRIQVRTPDGRTVEIVVPTGCVGGQSINVVIDNNVTSHSSTTVHDNAYTNTSERSTRAAIGAAAAAAVVGVILIGPVTGVIVAGAAIYATTREDSIGDAARKSGVVACSAYDFGMQKAKEHNVFERLKDASAATYRKAQEINDEHKITETAAARAKELNEDHKITERLTAATLDAAVRTPGAISSLFKMVSAAAAANKAAVDDTTSSRK